MNELNSTLINYINLNVPSETIARECCLTVDDVEVIRSTPLTRLMLKVNSSESGEDNE
jgi:hypothetical protein